VEWRNEERIRLVRRDPEFFEDSDRVDHNLTAVAIVGIKVWGRELGEGAGKGQRGVRYAGHCRRLYHPLLLILIHPTLLP
jgi:hypothetical protein